MIFGYVKGQTLELHYDKIVSESVDYLTAEFNFFKNEWEGFTKWAHFKKADQVFDVLLEGNKINKNAHLNLSSGEWEVYLHGNSDTGERITTNVVRIKVEPTGVLNGEPLPEIPLSVAEQVTALAQRAVEVAESVRADADNGEFDGEKGDDYVLTEHDRDEIAQKATTEIREELKDKADLIDGKVPEEQLPDNLLNKDNLQETINEVISQQFDKDKNGQVDKADDTDKLGGKPPEYYAASEDIPSIPKKVSEFENDAGYLTEHQSLDEYAKKEDVPTNVSDLKNDVGYAKQSDVNLALNNKVDVETYNNQMSTIDKEIQSKADIDTINIALNDKADKAEIPTKTSQLQNDSGYLTEHQSLENYPTRQEVVEGLNKKQNVIDRFVETVNGYSGQVSLSAGDVHALPDSTIIPVVPSVVSAFDNDADYADKKYVAEVLSGKCKSYTFDTVSDLDAWLNEPSNTENLNNGDVFYIREVGVPDYWWDSETESKQILETTKVDLTDYAKKQDIPLNVSQLVNDSNYTTEAQVDTKLGGKQDKLTKYVSSVNGRSGDVSLTASDVGALPQGTFIPTVPDKISAFQNDAGYLTEHQDLSDYAKKSEIPVKTSQLTNDSGYLTQHQDLSAYAKTSEVNSVVSGVEAKIPTKTSQLTNDSGFLTEHQSLEGYAKTSDLSKVAKSNSYNDLDNKPTIPTIPSSLPANGGNADTVDGKHIVVSSSVPTNNDTSIITIVV